MLETDEKLAYPDGIIFDIDGTLYHQPPVRRGMALKLVGHLLRHPGDARLFQALMKYRSLRETELGRTLSEKEQIERIADLCSVDVGHLAAFIQRWMFEEPLSLIVKHANVDVIAAITSAGEHGAVLAAYSDYRADEKLQALGIRPDFVFYPGHGILDELKPSPAAMKDIVLRMEIDPRSIVYYGDRPEKDGASASFESIRYINVR